ncbi:MAG: hypothetical protein DCC65_07360 [Planctomycetota bacterium]|nr:MAG: hypothetical protein DCC65_07360 [Planctomycetota bacterium]
MAPAGPYPDLNPTDCRRPAWLVWLCFVAAGACLARDASGRYFGPPGLAMALQAPAIVSWLFAAVSRARGALILRGQDRALTLAAFLGGLILAIVRQSPDVFLVTITASMSGVILVDWLVLLVRKLDRCRDRPLAVFRAILVSWLGLGMICLVLLSLPLATLPGVPDYRHNFWMHVANCAFTSVSTACLNGVSAYGFGDDFSAFGRIVIFLQTQLSGMAWAAAALVAVRPFLRNDIGLNRLLLLCVAVQLAAATVVWSAWDSADTPTRTDRTWWSLLHVSSAFWNTGWTQRADGLARYLSVPRVFATTAILAIIGSLGLPVMYSLLRRAERGNDPHRLGVPAWKRLPQFEVWAALFLLILSAGALFVIETPRFLPDVLVPDRPLDFGSGRVSIRDPMPHQTRWTMAVFVAATLRSAGLQSLPLSEGAISWPGYALILGLMAVGGSIAGTASGMRNSTILLILISLFSARLAWTQHPGGHAARRVILRSALLIVLACAALQIASAWLLASTTDGTKYEVVFDSVAAVSNVGLSTGLALHLTGLGKIVMMLSMLAGRVLPMFLWLRMSSALVRLTAQGFPQDAQPK